MPGHCSNGRLHDYTPFAEDLSVFVEVCKRCGRKARFTKDTKGRVDNHQFLQENRRDFLQRKGATAKEFEREYGKPKDMGKVIKKYREGLLKNAD